MTGEASGTEIAIKLSVEDLEFIAHSLGMIPMMMSMANVGPPHAKAKRQIKRITAAITKVLPATLETR